MWSRDISPPLPDKGCCETLFFGFEREGLAGGCSLVDDAATACSTPCAVAVSAGDVGWESFDWTLGLSCREEALMDGTAILVDRAPLELRRGGREGASGIMLCFLVPRWELEVEASEDGKSTWEK